MSTNWYHEQWGQPTRNDAQLFELLTVGVFQVGLSWRVITNKRASFLKNFQQFQPQKVAALLPDELEKIVADPKMIRNPRKINATVGNAQAILKIQAEYGSFSTYMWHFVADSPVERQYVSADEIPRTSPLGQKVARELKKRGFKFVGPIVTEMFLRAAGLIHDEVLT